MRVAFLLFILAISACAPIRTEKLSESEVLQILATSDSAVLYSLEPWTSPNTAGERLQGFLVRGKTELDHSKTQEATTAFKDAILAWESSGNNFAAACFDPRHALRIVSNEHTYDFLLCYQCLQLEVFEDDESVAWFGVMGSPAVLNEMLASANIPLSKAAK